MDLGDVSFEYAPPPMVSPAQGEFITETDDLKRMEDYVRQESRETRYYYGVLPARVQATAFGSKTDPGKLTLADHNSLEHKYRDMDQVKSRLRDSFQHWWSKRHSDFKTAFMAKPRHEPDSENHHRCIAWEYLHHWVRDEYPHGVKKAVEEDEKFRRAEIIMNDVDRELIQTLIFAAPFVI
ncbi:MAG: hypothetical protein Q9224_007568 [Gallowayella concinna]